MSDGKAGEEIEGEVVADGQQAQRQGGAEGGAGEDVAGVAVYLASPASKYHTGDVLRIDGGYLKF